MQGICQLHNQDEKAVESAEEQECLDEGRNTGSEMEVLNNLMHESDVSPFPGEYFGCCY